MSKLSIVSILDNQHTYFSKTIFGEFRSDESGWEELKRQSTMNPAVFDINWIRSL
jgi:hypothetical protein